jgi:hypothetical protein
MLSNEQQNLLLKSIAWVVLWFGFSYWEFGVVFVILSLFGFIFSNMGERKDGELSAYSVFNQGFKKLLGDKSVEQLENEMRMRGSDPNTQPPPPKPRQSSPQQSGKLGRNSLCPCDSGRKFKKCCAVLNSEDEHSD